MYRFFNSITLSAIRTCINGSIIHPEGLRKNRENPRPEGSFCIEILKFQYFNKHNVLLKSYSA